MPEAALREQRLPSTDSSCAAAAILEQLEAEEEEDEDADGGRQAGTVS